MLFLLFAKQSAGMVLEKVKKVKKRHWERDGTPLSWVPDLPSSRSEEVRSCPQC